LIPIEPIASLLFKSMLSISLFAYRLFIAHIELTSELRAILSIDRVLAATIGLMFWLLIILSTDRLFVTHIEFTSELRAILLISSVPDAIIGLMF